MAIPMPPLPMRRRHFDPVPELARLHDEAPVSRVEFPFPGLDVPVSVWVVTRYEDVRAVLADTDHFSNAAQKLGDEGALIGDDPPEHTRLRRMLTGEFTVRRIERLRPRIEAIVAEHLDAMADMPKPVDLVEAFALPIPSLVICELLGVPYADREGFQRRASSRLDLSRPGDAGAHQAVVEESKAYMGELVARQRAEPGDDLLGMLVREHGDDLTDRELVAIGDLLLLAGHETTSNMLGLGTALLLQRPDQLALLRDSAEHVNGAVEELLRYLSVAHFNFRVVKADTVVGGEPMKAGDMVIASLVMSNRDRSLADDPGRFDITRKPGPHVAFGYGVHHCIGAPLARMEMRVAFPALLRRYPGLRLAVPFDEVTYRAFSAIYGVAALPVTW